TCSFVLSMKFVNLLLFVQYPVKSSFDKYKIDLNKLSSKILLLNLTKLSDLMMMLFITDSELEVPEKQFENLVSCAYKILCHFGSTNLHNYIWFLIFGSLVISTFL
ncbi:hypothetical protein L9F63_001361, partial [Diploptera punctata]